MKLKDIAVISGKPGLYRIIKPTRTGVIVEAIGGGKTKIMADASHRISILKEISIYVTDKEDSIPLAEVFYRIHEKYGEQLEVAKDDNALRSFLEEIVPSYDKKRVYVSDMKKLVSWYQILSENIPDLLDRSKAEPEEDEQAEKSEEGEAAEDTKAQKTEKQEA
ncbi:MAG: DUF5606 domain-containing protein [Bernardetiaceae bacterium]|nr:DUF5606 domain-containing protein [Bernardetiaceae bacterium]